MYKWLFLLLFPLSLFARFNFNGDFEIWNNQSFQLDLSPRTFLHGEAQFRYGDHGKKLFHKHYEGVFYFRAGRRLALGPGYRQTFVRTQKTWANEYNPLFDILITWMKNPGAILINRNRFQYRILPKQLGSKSLLTFRSRFALMTPYRNGRHLINPYIANEFFWTQTRGFAQNRAQIGFFLPYRQRVFLDLFYMRRWLKNRQHKWLKQNVLGVHVQFFF